MASYTAMHLKSRDCDRFKSITKAAMKKFLSFSREDFVRGDRYKIQNANVGSVTQDTCYECVG